MSNVVTLVLTIVLTTINMVHVYEIKCQNCESNSSQMIENQNTFIELFDLLLLSQRTGKQGNDLYCEKLHKLQTTLFIGTNLKSNLTCCNKLSSKKLHRIDEDITLNCQMCTEIDANIKWLYNGGIINQDDEKYKITYQTLDNGFVSTNLTFSCADKSHTGTYVCRATNANEMNVQEYEFDILLKDQNKCTLFGCCFIVSITCVILVIGIVASIAYSKRDKSKTRHTSEVNNSENAIELDTLTSSPSN